MLRDVSFSVVYFPLFATLNSFGPRKNDGSGDAAFFVSFASGELHTDHFVQIKLFFACIGTNYITSIFFCSGCAAGSFAALFVNPFDVIKTRLQALKKAEGEAHFNGVADCIG